MIEAMVEKRPVSTPEYPVGSEIPILPHSRCSNSIGVVTKLNRFRPMEAKCIKPICSSRKVMIDWGQIQENKIALYD